MDKKEKNIFEKKCRKFENEGSIKLSCSDVDNEVENWINENYPESKMIPSKRDSLSGFSCVTYIKE